MSIDVHNESDIVVDLDHLHQCAVFALDHLRVHPAADMCMTLVEENTMAELHVRWMDLAGPTDVMSFPMDELRPGRDGEEPVEGVLGDLVLCPAYVLAQPGSNHDTLPHELAVLVVHGVLHLLGYDHAEPEEKREMFELQNRIVQAFLAQCGRESEHSTQPVSEER